MWFAFIVSIPLCSEHLRIADSLTENHLMSLLPFSSWLSNSAPKGVVRISHAHSRTCRSFNGENTFVLLLFIWNLEMKSNPGELTSTGEGSLHTCLTSNVDNGEKEFPIPINQPNNAAASTFTKPRTLLEVRSDNISLHFTTHTQYSGVSCRANEQAENYYGVKLLLCRKKTSNCMVASLSLYSLSSSLSLSLFLFHPVFFIEVFQERMQIKHHGHWKRIQSRSGDVWYHVVL